MFGLDSRKHAASAAIHSELAVRHTVPSVALLTADDRSVFETFACCSNDQDALVILNYHDITAVPQDKYDVTPEMFAAQMSMLRTAGFSSVSLGEVLAWTAGQGALPDRSVLITFDDGTKASYTIADPILEAFEFRAVNFLITGSIGTHQPYYLTWAEVLALHASGRWEFGSHTRAGHVRLPIDHSGKLGAFLVNLIWLGDEGRAETLGEAESRIASDLDDSIGDFVAHGLPSPRAFAYPFSDLGEPGAVPELAAAVRTAVNARFEVQMLNVLGRSVSESDVRGRLLPRVEVVGEWSARGLFDAIAGARPPRILPRKPFTDQDAWSPSSVVPPVFAAFDGDALSVEASVGGWGEYVFARNWGNHWKNYSVECQVSGLGEDDNGAYVVISLLAGSGAPVRLKLSRSYFRLVGTEGQSLPLAEGRLEPSDRHDVWLAVSAAGQVSVALDGASAAVGWYPDAAGATGSIGLSAIRPSESAAKPVFSNLRLSPLD